MPTYIHKKCVHVRNTPQIIYLYFKRHNTSGAVQTMDLLFTFICSQHNLLFTKDRRLNKK